MSTGDSSREPLETASLEMLLHGIFAITMTLLVLDVRLPHDYQAGHLWDTVWAMRAQFAAYMFGFIYLIAAWLEFRRGFHRHPTLEMSVQICWLLMLAVIAVTPFLVSMLASSVDDSHDLATAVRITAVVVAVGNIGGVVGVCLHHRPAGTLALHGIAVMLVLSMGPFLLAIALSFVLPWLALGVLAFEWLIQLAADRLRRLWVRGERELAPAR